MGARTSRGRASHALRTAVAVAYYTFVVAFIVMAAVNIVRQLWVRSRPGAPAADCRSGLIELARAIERARGAASSSSDGDETLALARFRAALQPEWQQYDAIAASCRIEPSWASSLDVIERLRYAEERVVRRDVAELSPLRRKVVELLAAHQPNEPNEPNEH